MKTLLVMLVCYSLAVCEENIYEESGSYEDDNLNEKSEEGGSQEDQPAYGPTDTENLKIMKYSQECKDRNGLNDVLFQNMGRKLQRKEALGCFHECYYKKSGEMKPNGFFARDVMIRMMPISLVDECINDIDVVNSTDDCTRAYEMYKCVRKPLMEIMGFPYEEDS